MTGRLRIVVPGQPKPKLRHKRARLPGGTTVDYTPRPTVLHENWIRGKTVDAMAAQGWQTADCAVSVSIEAVLERPSSRKTAMYADRLPDVDNIAKSVLDALKLAGVFKTDSRVVRLVTAKRYTRPTEGPCTVVDVELLA